MQVLIAPDRASMAAQARGMARVASPTFTRGRIGGDHRCDRRFAA